MLVGLAVVGVMACEAMAQTADAPQSGRLWSLFKDSFDFFTILLILGSLVGMTVVFVCVIEIRETRIMPEASVRRVRELARTQRIDELKEFVLKDTSYVSNALRPALVHLESDRVALREAAELAASEESAKWFRKIEILNVIGNLGPLIGLAGTVWGMILAFTSLGEAGGQTQAANLSLGISKALFHTLLGLCLAIPCLFVFGLYRSIVDRICTRGMMIASEVVEILPVGKK